jgi:hypothetical protein
MPWSSDGEHDANTSRECRGAEFKMDEPSFLPTSLLRDTGIFSNTSFDSIHLPFNMEIPLPPEDFTTSCF